MKNKNKEKNEIQPEDKISIHRGLFSTLLISLFLIFFTMGGVFVAYLFIHNSRVSYLADVHLTDKIELAKRKALGTSYSNPQKNIYNWIVYKDEVNGFEIAYPDSWDAAPDKDNVFEIRKYNSKKASNESLAAFIMIEYSEKKDGKTLEDYVKSETGMKEEYMQEFILSGKRAIMPSVEYKGKDPTSPCMFWERNGNFYHLRGVYFNEKTEELEDTFNKIVGEFKII